MSCIMCNRSVLNSLSDPCASKVFLCYEKHFQCRKCTGSFAGRCGKCGGMCRVLRVEFPYEFLGKDQANEDEGDRMSDNWFGPHCKTMRDVFEMKEDPKSSVDSVEEVSQLPKCSPVAATKIEKMETIWETPEIDFSDSASSSSASKYSLSDSPRTIAVMPKTLTIPEILARAERREKEEEKKNRLSKLSIQKLTSYCILPEELETSDTANSPFACSSLETVVGLAVSEEINSSCEKKEDKDLEEAVPEVLYRTCETQEHKTSEEAVSDSVEEALPDSSDLSESEPELEPTKFSPNYDADVSENELIPTLPVPEAEPPSDEDLSDSELSESYSNYEADESDTESAPISDWNQYKIRGIMMMTGSVNSDCEEQAFDLLELKKCRCVKVKVEGKVLLRPANSGPKEPDNGYCQCKNNIQELYGLLTVSFGRQQDCGTEMMAHGEVLLFHADSDCENYKECSTKSLSEQEESGEKWQKICGAMTLAYADSTKPHEETKIHGKVLLLPVDADSEGSDVEEKTPPESGEVLEKEKTPPEIKALEKKKTPLEESTEKEKSSRQQSVEKGKTPPTGAESVAKEKTQPQVAESGYEGFVEKEKTPTEEEKTPPDFKEQKTQTEGEEWPTYVILIGASAPLIPEPIDPAATISVARRPVFTGPKLDAWHSGTITYPCTPELCPDFGVPQLSVSSKHLILHKSIAYCPAPDCYEILCTASIIDHLHSHNRLWRMPSLELNQAMGLPIDLRRLTSPGTAKCLMVMMLKNVVFGLGDPNYEQNLLPLLLMSMHVDLDDVVPESCLHQSQTLVWVATLTGSVLPLKISFTLWPLAGGSPESIVTYSGSARDMRSSLNPRELMKSSQVLSLNEDQAKGLTENDTNMVGIELLAKMAPPVM